MNRLALLCLLVSLGTAAPGCVDQEQDSATHLCPPPEPYGTEEGSSAAPLTLWDLDDQPLSTHDSCGDRVVLLYHFYGW